MQATACFHDGVTYPILQKTDFVLHDPVAFHPTDRVFNSDADGGKTTIRRLLLEHADVQALPGQHDRGNQTIVASSNDGDVRYRSRHG